MNFLVLGFSLTLLAVACFVSWFVSRRARRIPDPLEPELPSREEMPELFVRAVKGDQDAANLFMRGSAYYFGHKFVGEKFNQAEALKAAKHPIFDLVDFKFKAV